MDGMEQKAQAHGYRRDIDGLRAVAVLPVVLYHAGVGFPGGYVGVDVFFVISGYLISGLLVREMEGGGFSLVEFWHRRVRRIFPALFMMVAVTLLVGGLMMIPDDFKELGQSALAQCFMASNIFFWSDTGYFATAAESKPLLHTWSLGVEEQFYLLFPLFLAWLRHRVSKHMAVILLSVLGGSLVLNLATTGAFPSAAFFLLPGRAWELLLGAVLVFYPLSQNSNPAGGQWVGELAAVLGLVCILVPATCYSNQTPFPGFAAIPPCLGAALILWTGQKHQTSIHRVLSCSPLVAVGLISYSLYLWHWPVLVYSNKFTSEGGSTIKVVAAQMLIAVTLAVLSWRFVETPFRRRLWMASMPSMFRFGLAGTVSLAIIGGIASATKGLPQRLPERVRRLSENPQGLDFDQNLGITAQDIVINRVPKLGAIGDTGPSFALWGDSHAMAISPVVDVLGKQHGRWGYILSRVGTPPLLNTWRAGGDKSSVEFNQAAVDFIRRHRIPLVILVSYWALNVEGAKNGSGHGLITDNEKSPPTPENAQASFQRQLLATVESIQECGARVAILRQVPEQDIHVRDVLTSRMILGHPLEGLGISRERYRVRQSRVNRMLDGLSNLGVSLLDPAPLLMGMDQRSILIHNGRATYADSGHLSVEGSLMLRPLLEPVLEKGWAP